MQEEIILKLKSDLEFKLSNLELQNKSNKEVLNIIDQIINEHMNNNNYDLDKIRFIYPILNMEISFDEMEKYILFVSSEGVDKDIFKEQIDLCLKKINILMSSLKKYYQDNGPLSDNYKTNEIQYNELKQVLDIILNININNLISNDVIEKIVNYMSKYDYLDCDITLFCTSILMNNSKIISSYYEKKIESKVESITEKKEIPSLEEKVKLLKRATIISGLYKLNDLSAVMNQISILNKANNTSDRIKIYLSSNSYDNRVAILIYDLKNNILPKFNNLENVTLSDYYMLKEILDTYDLIMSDKNNTAKISSSLRSVDILGQFKLDDMLDLYNKVLNILDLINKNNTDINNPKIYDDIYNLKTLKEDFDSAISLYYSDPESYSNKELLDSYYSWLSDAYLELQNEFIINEENSKDIKDYEAIAQDFYNSSSTNLYIFIDNNEYSVEEDIYENPVFKSNGVDTVAKGFLNKLYLNLNGGFIGEGNHKAKSDDYSDLFLKKYKVKSERGNGIRIFYSVFSTNISEKFSEYKNVKNIIFLYSVSYGNTAEKGEFYSKALKICYDNRDRIDYIVDLFNTDWSSINKEEEQVKLDTINNILKSQKMCLGHLIDRCGYNKIDEVGKKL